jgi:hypothetical protein
MVKHTPNIVAGPIVTSNVRGRGAAHNPANRFERLSLAVAGQDDAPIDVVPEELADGRRVQTAVYEDHSKTVINRVDSPDLPFSWTINPLPRLRARLHLLLRPAHARDAGLQRRARL